MDTAKSLRSVIDKVNLRQVHGRYLPIYQTVDYFACSQIVKKANYHQIIDAECVCWTIYQECISWARQHPTAKKLSSPIISKNVDSILKSAPRFYKILLPLPDSKKLDCSSQINKDMQLVCLSEDDTEVYQHSSPDLKSNDIGLMLNALADGQTNALFYEGQNALLIDDVGFIDLSNELLLKYDPFYLYKIYIAASIVWGALARNDHRAERALGLRGYEYYIYEKQGNKYVRSVQHSEDDSRLLNEYSFTTKELVDHVNKLFNGLIAKQKDAAVTKLQNSIKKSLYWFYEAQKVPYMHLRVVHLCTALDAFFDQYDSDLQKKQVIALEASETVKQQSLVLDEINKLQLRRNSIVHGEAEITYALHSSRKTAYTDRSLTVGGEIFLTKFISKKMERFIKSI